RSACKASSRGARCADAIPACPTFEAPSPIPGGTGAVRLEAASEELAHPERAVGSASDADSNGIEMGAQQVCAMRGAVPERAVRVDDGRRVRDVLAREGRREPRGLEAPFGIAA